MMKYGNGPTVSEPYLGINIEQPAGHQENQPRIKRLIL